MPWPPSFFENSVPLRSDRPTDTSVLSLASASRVEKFSTNGLRCSQASVSGYFVTSSILAVPSASVRITVIWSRSLRIYPGGKSPPAPNGSVAALAWCRGDLSRVKAGQVRQCLQPASLTALQLGHPRFRSSRSRTLRSNSSSVEASV